MPEKNSARQAGQGAFEKAQARVEKMAAAARTAQVVQLPLWADASRGIPNEVVRSALFTTRGRRIARRFLRDEPVLVLGDGQVHYRGEELRTDDEDVWLQVMHLAREQPLGECVQFTAYAFLRDLNWPTTAYYYKKLREHLARLQANAVTVSSKRLEGGVSLSLIRRFEWQDERGEALRRWRVWVEPEMRALFGDRYYTLLEWHQRRQLTPTAKRLYDYWASHRRPYPVKVASLRDLCGSSTQSLRRWRQQLRSVLTELLACDFLGSAHIDPDTDLVHVQRAEGQSLPSP